MRKLFLHIGYPKTGTTSLQRFFAANAATLQQHGILFPATGRIYDAHYKLNFSLGLGENRQNPAEAPHELAAALRQEVDAAAPRATIVSSEYFVTAKDPSIVKSFFDGFETRVVVYLRRHDKALESNYAQSVKTNPNPPKAVTLETFISNQLTRSTTPYDYLATLERWSDVFGRDKIIVRPFERSQNTPDLYHDFLSTIGEPWIDALACPPQEANSAVSAKVLDAIDAVQRSSAHPQTKKKVVGRLVQIDRKVTAEDRGSRLSPSFRQALIAQFERSYREIARRYLGRPDGALFHEMQPADDPDWQPAEPLSPADAIDLVLHALAPWLKA